jgi:putative peptide-modifying radical SAM enzyme
MQEFDNGLEKKWKFDFSAPPKLEVDLEKLKKFLKSEDTLIFYGGEPLLNIQKMEEIMDNIKVKSFCMQTNGKLLHFLPKEYMNKFSRILVSLDGSEERTDFNRGKETYKQVSENIRLIRKNGFKGEIVARMTLSFPDIFQQILELEKIKEIDSFHWQIDAGFYKNDFNEEYFSKFAEEYNLSLSNLADYWIEKMESKKKVLKLYPLIGIFESLYYNKNEKLRCGAGYANYTITTDGKITVCPIMNNIKEFYCGDLNSKSEELTRIYVQEPCVSCNYFKICGGRCLYSNKAKLWPPQGQELICKTVIHLIETIKVKIPKIKKLIKENYIEEKDFFYEKYFGPEIIP